ncbi:ATP-binding cassette domain-containing protein [Salipaludibacillus sp. CUR1]|uniref:ATP-binding cassette domain-containing protein n=1 Tax=Salipaludibacillus sp. CUR1 TaxID=2820003 RepID=UPI001E5F024F|nr:ATP-binding cassette domain-containing protein [Salipaludibacillus sp. CUR1]MCE7791775.1 ATP-binding cassette domain-containing protein [Salipaludibacillus sp. CUR1]
MKTKVSFSNVTKVYNLYKRKSDKLLGIIFPGYKEKQFNAIYELSFDVREGETIGVVGINGSGKSTLSNLLAQVVPPTSGDININGEPSLIAISAGLNGHLSGIENIRLKCLMLGMENSEVERLIPQIIEFADIGDFMDQPVKNYSSGMKARLGFAISVHTNPDILIVDEALSVGDQTFYERCIKKINEFKQEGKTIFFISHSIGQIQSISDRVMWLHFGQLKEFGPAETVIKKYQGFIDWFNNLDTKAQKNYKAKELKAQSHERMNQNEKKRKPGKGDILAGLQAVVILLFTVFAAALLLMDQPVSALWETDDEETREETAEENGLENEGEADEEESPAVEIEEAGFITAEDAAIYESEDLASETEELEFGELVFVSEETDGIYYIEAEENEGYVESAHVTLESGINESAVSIEDLSVIFPDVFSASWQYHLAHMNLEEEDVRDTYEGLTDEGETDDQETYLEYGYDEAVFYFDDEELTRLVISNVNADEEDFESIREDQAVLADEGVIYYFETDDYGITVNMDDETVEISHSRLSELL